MWIWLGIFWSTIVGSLLLSEVIVWLIESVYVLAYTFSFCSADEKTRYLQDFWCMFEDPVTGKRSSGFLVDVWRACCCWWDFLLHEVWTKYFLLIKFSIRIRNWPTISIALCFLLPMKLWKPLVGNKQGEKKTARTSSVLDTLKGNMTFVWI